ncbi:MAG: protein kinase [Deltaproteobacteria bacterium]|nr:protein kinase [Deltaproteobacteria bacterium]
MNSEDFTGQLLDGKYMLTKKLGEGGMGAVYSGQHITMGKMVAVKILHSVLINNEEVVHRFIREAQAAVAISHKNVVDILDLGALPSGEPFMVMEYLKGAGLDELIAVHKHLTLPAACAILEPTLRAIGAAHEKGVIHRDLKPENIFLNQESNDEVVVKLIDFGISKIQDQAVTRLTQEGTTLGTPEYMSPEQVRGSKETNHLTDIYAAGIIFYEMLSGDTPFEGEQYAALLANILTTEPRHPTRVYKAFPMKAWPVIHKAINKNPHARYQSAAEMVEAVSRLCTEEERERGMAILPMAITIATSGKSIPPQLDVGYSQKDANVILSDLAQQNAMMASETLLRTTSIRHEAISAKEDESSKSTVNVSQDELFSNLREMTAENVALSREDGGEIRQKGSDSDAAPGKKGLFASPFKKFLRVVIVAIVAGVAILIGKTSVVPEDMVDIEIVDMPKNAEIFYKDRKVGNPFEAEISDSWTPIRVVTGDKTRMRFVVRPNKDMRIRYVPGARKAEFLGGSPNAAAAQPQKDAETKNTAEKGTPESTKSDKAEKKPATPSPESISNATDSLDTTSKEEPETKSTAETQPEQVSKPAQKEKSAVVKKSSKPAAAKKATAKKSTAKKSTVKRKPATKKKTGAKSAGAKKKTSVTKRKTHSNN